MSTVTVRRASDLVQGSVDLSSPPFIYDRLVEVINHPRGGAADVAKVVREDTALTARLLKVVNSAFFAFPRPVDTVSQAVTVVGTSQIRDLALATSVVALFKDVPPELIDMDKFWRHSLACGVGARVLAGLRREGNPERFFVSGILHDVGKLIVFQRCPEDARSIMEKARDEGMLMHHAEREVLGFDHASVGEALLTQWNMPGSLREAIRFHHNPRRADRYPVETAAVHVGDILANALGFGNGGEAYVPPLEPVAWDTLALDVALVSSAIEEIDRQFQAAVHLVGLDAGA
jgi:HD-like signal output (HDOD) protein